MIEDYQWPLLSWGRGLKYQCKGKVFTIHGSLPSRGVWIEMPSLGPTKAMRTDALFVGVDWEYCYERLSACGKCIASYVEA